MTLPRPHPDRSPGAVHTSPGAVPGAVHQRRSRDARTGDPGALGLVPIAQAARLMGVTEGHLRRRCVSELGRDGRVRKLRVPGFRNAIWHIHESADPALRNAARGADAPAVCGRIEREASPAPSAAELLRELPESKRREAAARAAALIEFRSWRQGPGVVVKRDIGALLARLDERFGVRTSRTRLYRWDEIAPASEDPAGVAWALADRRGLAADPDTGELRRDAAVSPEAWSHFESLYLAPNKLSAAQCARLTAREAARSGWAWPSSQRHVQRLVRERITPESAVYAREGRAAWLKRCAPSIEQDSDAWCAGECWEGDHSRLDFFARARRGGRWVPVRLWLTAWVDRRSRMLVGWHIAESASSDGIRAALRRALESPGISAPRVVWIDNGRDYASRVLTGATKMERRRRKSKSDAADAEADWRGLFSMLGIDAHFGLPFNPNSKARVERMFGTMHGEFCRSFPSWCGSEDDPRGDRDGLDRILADAESLPTIDAVRERFALWADRYNTTAEHAVADLRDRDTGERLSRRAWYERELYARTILADPAVLSMLDARWSRPLAVGKNGVGLTIAGRVVRYGQHAAALRDLAGSDRRVVVSHDPADTTRIRVWSHPDLRFICEAPENELAGGVARDPVSVEQRKRAHARKRAAERRVREQIDVRAIHATPSDLAMEEAWRDEVDATRSRLREAGVDVADDAPPLRIVRTPIDGEPERAERESMRLAAGAEHTPPPEEEPIVFDRPAAPRLCEPPDDDDLDFEFEFDHDDPIDDDDDDELSLGCRASTAQPRCTNDDDDEPHMLDLLR